VLRYALSVGRCDRCDQEGGFSLIELLVGTLTVIVCLGAVINVCLQTGRVRQSDEELNLAYMACLNNLEDLRTVPFADLPGLNGKHFDVPALNGTPKGLAPQPGDSDDLAGEFIITVDGTGGDTTIYHVTAQVRWLGCSGRSEFKLETLIGERKYQ
jgi:type II secretory pathway pseudopilin PulG